MSAAVSPPTGSRKPSADRVLRALLTAASAKEAGTVCSLSLHHPRCAGIGAHTRVSELRGEGWRISKEPCHCPDRCRPLRERCRKRGERMPSNRWAYRLDAHQARDAIDREDA